MEITIILNIVILIMFITMFVFVIRIWNFQQEILHSGGYPSVVYSRARRDATAVLSSRVPWDYDIDEIIEIKSTSNLCADDENEEPPEKQLPAEKNKKINVLGKRSASSCSTP